MSFSLQEVRVVFKGVPGGTVFIVAGITVVPSILAACKC